MWQSKIKKPGDKQTVGVLDAVAHMPLGYPGVGAAVQAACSAQVMPFHQALTTALTMSLTMSLMVALMVALTAALMMSGGPSQPPSSPERCSSSGQQTGPGSASSSR